MKNKIRVYNRVAAILFFIGLPLLFWALDDIPRRTNLKEALSILTLVAFSMMLAQFFLARSNRKMLNEHKMSQVVKWHKAIGYIFVAVLMVHPLFIIIPRYFEAGISPWEAFLTLITTFDSLGVVLGMVAWGLMLVIGITSIFRNHLPFSYTTWRALHGVLSIAFITAATWHSIDLGRHTDKPMAAFFVLMAAGGALLLLSTYFVKSKKEITQ